MKVRALLIEAFEHGVGGASSGGLRLCLGTLTKVFLHEWRLP